MPPCQSLLRPSVTLAELEQFAQLQSDTEAALEMQRAKRQLMNRIGKLSAGFRGPTRSTVEMPGPGQPWKTALAGAMDAARRFPPLPTALENVLAFSTFPPRRRLFFSFSSSKPTKGPLLLSLPTAFVQAHPSMRKC